MSKPVTFRVTAEDRAKLEGIRNQSGLPLGNILRTLLLNRKIDEMVDNAYHKGLTDGYADGLSKGRESSAYTLRAPCSTCGKKMDLDFQQSEEAVETYRRIVNDIIKPAGWKHTSCPPLEKK